MNNKVLSLMFFLPFLLLSCKPMCKFWFNDVKIGDNIAYVEADSRNKEILYCLSSPCCNSGISLVPNMVTRYKANSKWVLAKSDKDGFYIIDKSFERLGDIAVDSVTNYVYGPFSEKEFQDKIREWNIDLEW